FPQGTRHHRARPRVAGAVSQGRAATWARSAGASLRLQCSSERSRARGNSYMARAGRKICDRQRYRMIAKRVSGRRCERRTGFGADAFDHGAQSIRALRRQVFAQPDASEQRFRVDLQNILRALAGIKRNQNSDESSHDVRITVAVEYEHRSAGAVRFHMREEPHLAGAALHLVGFDVRVFRHWRERAAKLDHVAVTVVPLIEQREIVDNLVNVHRAESPSHPARMPVRYIGFDGPMAKGNACARRSHGLRLAVENSEVRPTDGWLWLRAAAAEGQVRARPARDRAASRSAAPAQKQRRACWRRTHWTRCWRASRRKTHRACARRLRLCA